jgi:acyl homoserine lactone synthase
MDIVIARREDGMLSANDLEGMHMLRYQVFRRRLNWEVPVDGEREQDDFDRLADATYMVVRGDAGQVLGCWRLLPTEGPNMLRDTFPQLLEGAPAPRGTDIWELSRFATRSDGGGEAVAAFTRAMPLQMMRAVVDFARGHGIRRYVTVTTVAVERMLRSLGVNVSRLGAPATVGIERAVALNIEIDAKTVSAVFRDTDLTPAPVAPLARAQRAANEPDNVLPLRLAA